MTHPKADGLDALKRDIAIEFYGHTRECWSLPLADQKIIDHLAQRGMLNCGWMDIESAPKNQLILGYCKDLGIQVMSWSLGSWGDSVYEEWGCEPTHWMPLPAAPKMEGME